MLIHIPGEPLPMPRHRVRLARAGQKLPARKCPGCKERLYCRRCGCPVSLVEHPDRRYDDEKRRMRRLVATLPDLLVAPLAVTLRFTLPVPASWPRWRTEAALAQHEHPIGPRTGDWDNLGKLPMDVFQDVLYANDSQVVRALVTKQYGPEPGTDLLVEEMPRVLTADEWRGREQLALFGGAR